MLFVVLPAFEESSEFDAPASSARALGIAFGVLGLATFFSRTAEAAIIGVLIGQELWMLAAPIALALTRPQPE
ncbi:MAG: hypothetical protein WCA22_18150 [Candidatus Binatus sp.]